MDPAAPLQFNKNEEVVTYTNMLGIKYWENIKKRGMQDDNCLAYAELSN